MEKLRIKAGEKLSHAYIIASLSGGERSSLAVSLAAAMLCEGTGDRPCGTCRHCRKALAGIHPDIATVSRETDSSGRPRREIVVSQIRAVAADAQIMPNEADGKVYIISDADAMNTQAQNAFLKLLEEPPDGVSFILCASSAAGLLPTVRSRCVLMSLNSDAEGDEQAAQDAEGLLRAASGDRVNMLRWSCSNENMDARRADAMLRSARGELADVLCGRGRAKLPPERCMELDALFSRCCEYLKQNVGVKHVFGLLAVDAVPSERTK